ncbi:hypothetical protein MKX07_006512 [Trichoderma sp. CBMAI-0711]|nr:hypothetical protein MKX07_006512 [Trichoderma sp. CBMAI-0711]
MSALVVLDVTGALVGSILGGEGVALDFKGSVLVARLGDRGGSDATEGIGSRGTTLSTGGRDGNGVGGVGGGSRLSSGSVSGLGSGSISGLSSGSVSSLSRSSSSSSGGSLLVEAAVTLALAATSTTATTATTALTGLSIAGLTVLSVLSGLTILSVAGLTILSVLAILSVTILAVLGILTVLSVLTGLTILSVAILTVLGILTVLTVLSVAVLTALTILAILAILTVLTVLAVVGIGSVVSVATLAVLTVLAVLSILSILAVVVLAVVAVVLAVVAVVLAVVAVVLAIVAIVAIVAVATNGEADAVILSTTLSHGHQHRLVVGSRGHGAQAVVSGGQAVGNGGRQQTLAVASIVDTLEEDKELRVQGLGGVQRVTGALDSDVSVANDVAVAVNVLGSRIVGGGGVGEGARGKVEHLDLNVEGGVLVNVVAVLGVHEDGRNHVFGGGDVAHGDTIARARPDLLTVGESLALAEVDEVGVVTVFLLGPLEASQSSWLYLRSRSRLAIGTGVVAVLLGTGLDEVGIQSGAAVATIVTTIASVVAVVAVVAIVAIVAIVATALSSFQGATKEGSSFDVASLSQDSQADNTGENVLDLHGERCEGGLQRKKK